MEDYVPFRLTETFIDKYKRKKPPFGFNGLGELVYKRTYSRIKENGKNEEWWETIRRVVEGTYNIQKRWIESLRLAWVPQKAQFSAQEMYYRMWSMKILAPGRGLYAQGTDIIEKKKLTPALFNCSFISTETMKQDPSKPFTFAMDMLMCGVGIGADLLGAGTVEVKGQLEGTEVFVIPDSREGWVESLDILIKSFFYKIPKPIFDYTEIRAEGLPIKTFGGVSSGSGPLKEMHIMIEKTLSHNAGSLITIRTIADIFNFIGKTVVAGNVRRSAILLAGLPIDEFLDLKNYEKNPDRIEYGWASNNSVIGTVGMNYKEIAERIRINGEPGLLWPENAHANGRFGETNSGLRADTKTKGTNPCGEIFLESGEKCNLCEVFLSKHDTLEDFIRSLKYAYLYSKTITLLDTHWPETNQIMLRNRRVGTGVGAVAQFLANNSIDTLKHWLNEGYAALKNYDESYSDWFAIPRSIRLSTMKPSGSISILVGATPGQHYPESRFYIRRVRLANDSPLLEPLRKAGYVVEKAFGQEATTSVVEVPVDVGEHIRTLEDVSMWEQLEMAAFMQKYWADNSVSVTITFDPETEGPYIEQALDIFQYKLKSVSFLPKLEGGAYPQMPYEKITEDAYNKLIKNIKSLSFKKVKGNNAEVEKFCSNDSCEI